MTRCLPPVIYRGPRKKKDYEKVDLKLEDVSTFRCPGIFWYSSRKNATCVEGVIRDGAWRTFKVKRIRKVEG